MGDGRWEMRDEGEGGGGGNQRKDEWGRGRQLYWEDMASPYAPAERMAMRSSRRVSGRVTSRAKVSDDSQMGPTTS